MYGITSDGKSARCRSGKSAPKTVGPRRIPARTSPITRGWRKCATAAPMSRANSITTTTARKKAATASVKSRCLAASTFSAGACVELALGAVGAAHVAGEPPVLEPHPPDDRAVGLLEPDELARLAHVHLQAGAARGRRGDVVATGDRGLRLLVAPRGEDGDHHDDGDRAEDRVVDDQPPCG